MKIWSLSEKQQLVELVKQYDSTSRINWQNISKYFENRSPQQCKLQYRNVLATQLNKVNFEWSEEEHVKFELLFCIYGNKWTFIQQNYFPYLKPEQLQLKYQLLKIHTKQYFQIINGDLNKQLTVQEMKLVQIGLRRITAVQEKLQIFKENKPGLVLMDLLELKFLKEVVTENIVQQMDEQLLKLNTIVKNQEQFK
ncbi:Myb-like_DNA-binding domain-containing protein [Hexamita inflata]|uniref:Myb-like DNA-binding domain-containing protein n=1 Tax=Hexamita inflata TaxID=28002 RepID=A0AA86P7K3_9EUKA|nr:Myb-like DNA-binding domain-containing protein [Hexamita inflata]